MLNCIRPLIEVSKLFLIQQREFEKHKMVGLEGIMVGILLLVAAALLSRASESGRFGAGVLQNQRRHGRRTRSGIRRE